MSEADPVSEDSSDEAGGGPRETPYKNLFVPLFVVPAMIVMVVVLVFAVFGQIAGSEASLEENLDRVRLAGANEREQALFHVVQQVEANWIALQQGREIPWPVEGDIGTRLERAFDETPREDARFRYVLAAAMAQMEVPGAVDRLLESLAYTQTEDPGGTVRFSALVALGVASRRLPPEEHGRVAAAVIPFLDDADPGLGLAAAAALQNLPVPESREALRSTLGAPSLELRGQAAVSLSHLADPAGASVLWELLDPKTFERENALDSDKFRDPRTVNAARFRAAEALIRLGRPEDVERLRGIAEDDPDREVREAAMRAIRAADESGGRGLDSQ